MATIARMPSPPSTGTLNRSSWCARRNSGVWTRPIRARHRVSTAARICQTRPATSGTIQGSSSPKAEYSTITIATAITVRRRSRGCLRSQYSRSTCRERNTRVRALSPGSNASPFIGRRLLHSKWASRNCVRGQSAARDTPFSRASAPATALRK